MGPISNIPQNIIHREAYSKKFTIGTAMREEEKTQVEPIPGAEIRKRVIRSRAEANAIANARKMARMARREPEYSPITERQLFRMKNKHYGELVTVTGRWKADGSSILGSSPSLARTIEYS